MDRSLVGAGHDKGFNGGDWRVLHNGSSVMFVFTWEAETLLDSLMLHRAQSAEFHEVASRSDP